MSTQKLLIGTLISTIFIFALDFIWYGMLMADTFTQVEGVDRLTPLWPWLILGIAVFSYAFCAIYAKGYEENKPLVSQGINYGIMISLLAVVSMAVIRYAVSMQWSLSHHLMDAVFHLVQLIILGIIIAKYFGHVNVKPGGNMSGDI